MMVTTFEGNDCLVGIKEGRLFIAAVKKCVHGNILDQVTVWLPMELKEKLEQIKDYDGSYRKFRADMN